VAGGALVLLAGGRSPLARPARAFGGAA
jgi:hypothetical protein